MVYEGAGKLGDFFKSRREKGISGLPTVSVTLTRVLVLRDSLDRKMDTNLTDEEHLLVRKGDIVYNMMRMWQGASGLANRDGLLSPAYVVLAPKKRMDSLYASYLFKSPRFIYLFWAYSYGLTNDRLRLYFNDFKNIPVTVPAIPEQQKIAQILSTWDKAIEKLEALIAAKQKRKKALMQQLLTGKKRFAGFEGEWKIFSLSKICELGAGQSAPKEEKYFSNGSYEFLRVSDIGGSNCRWAPKARDKVNDLAIKTFGLKFVPKGATLFTKSGASLLLNQRAQLEKETFVVSHLRYAIAEKNVCSDFLYFLLCEIDFKKYAAGTSLPALQLSTLANVKITVPPSLEEQQKIASVLTAADTEIQTHQKQLSTLKQQKKGLMQQLLTGKKRVKVEAHV